MGFVLLSSLCLRPLLPELEIVSFQSEGQPSYTLRADSVFGYANDDWLHTPLLPPEISLGLTYEQIEETLKYFCELCSIQTLPKSYFNIITPYIVRQVHHFIGCPNVK